MKSLYLTFLICFAFYFTNAQCNGYTELCDKRFDEVCIVMTHNAYNAEDEGFVLGNQTYGLERQLMDGVRGFMLDIYDDGTEIVVYHSVEILGKRPLQDELGFIKDFLDNNPTEILSIIFETNVTSTQLENELMVAGLMSYLHEQTLGTSWPTLQEMIDDDKRLVIFSESDNGQATQPWYHYAWAHSFDTNYSYADPSEFNCDVNRGDVTNSLYLVNHWITSGIGTGDINQATVVNANPLLIDRLQQCEMENNRFPNFIGV
ncbi:MAG: phosphatidylinositol-specific phospholipase C domain-containing protein, partial [Saprospiraceae bacterium]